VAWVVSKVNVAEGGGKRVVFVLIKGREIREGENVSGGINSRRW